jgi:oligosaccharide amylase
MPRDIPVGNGSLLVTFDELYRIRDIYFPHIGSENHSEGHPFRFGVWVDGAFSWVSSHEWRRELRYLPETLVTEVHLTNDALALEIIANDTVDFHENVFLRRVRVRNLAHERREARLFFHQDFYISETEVGDTAYFDPDTLAIIHYKANRYFLISTATAPPEGAETFAIGRKAFQGAEGTWRDAEDGVLSESAITEGSVDSTIGRTLFIEPHAIAEMFYWIAVGTSHEEVARIHRLVRERMPQSLIERTQSYWRAWVNKNEIDFGNLPEEVVRLFKRSLLIIRTQIDKGGAIIAANDSDVTLRATDHYSYLWPRDGALVAYALDLAGYSNLTRSFFALCARIISAEGYFLQKYNADGSVASSWHAAWDARTRKRLVPIQEDETALVLWALWNHYEEFRDIEFAKEVYHPLITHAADFLARFRDEETKLPLPSWNLWEDRRGIHTFTCASVVAGLRAAANFAKLFNDAELIARYEQAATEVRNAMREYLYRPELRRFARSIMPRDDGANVFDVDETVDASLFGIFYFGAFAPDDEIVHATMQAVEETLQAKTHVGGIARYEQDNYMRVTGDVELVPGNPWFICTLWLADYRIMAAHTLEDLESAVEILEWVATRTLSSGVLAEQVDPLTGAPLSVSPLTWSHSTVVATVMNYLRKLEALTNCEACGRPLFHYDRRARRIHK